MVSKEMVGGVPEGHAWSMVPKKDMVDDVQEDIKDSTMKYLLALGRTEQQQQSLNTLAATL